MTVLASFWTTTIIDCQPSKRPILDFQQSQTTNWLLPQLTFDYNFVRNLLDGELFGGPVVKFPTHKIMSKIKCIILAATFRVNMLCKNSKWNSDHQFLLIQYAYATPPSRGHGVMNPGLPCDLFLPIECSQSDTMPFPSLDFKILGSYIFTLGAVSHYITRQTT